MNPVKIPRATTRPGLPARLVLTLLLALGALPRPPVIAALPWLPITSDDISRSASTIDPEAGAEILYNLQEVDSKSDSSTTYRFYQRIKVYNEKGVRNLDKINIPAYANTKLRHVSARIITPDGSIIPIGKKDFHTRDVIRQGRQKIQVTSFSFPQLTPGSIVEWQSESLCKQFTISQRFELQGTMPTRHARIRYRPHQVPYGTLRSIFIRCADATDSVGKDGYHTFEKFDIPALKHEPFMPPVDDVQQWMYVFLTIPGVSPENSYYNDVYDLHVEMEKFVRPPKNNDPIKTKCDELLGEAPSPEERLARIHDFCRSQIRNIHGSIPGFTPSELEKLKPNKTAADVLARGYGTRWDITGLFIALARAAGYEAHIALCADRSERKFDLRFLALARPADLVAIVQPRPRQYKYHDPASLWLPAGELYWANQNTQACWHDPAHLRNAKPTTDMRGIRTSPRPRWSSTPLNLAGKNISKRTATLRLDENGTLEGDITFAPQGQQHYQAKNTYAGETVEARTANIRDDILARLPDAEVTNIVVHNADSPLDPLTITYHIRIPCYADATGQRLFVQPAFFRKNRPALFTGAERLHPINLEYPWSEEDEVTIAMPPGFSIEAGSSPHSSGRNNNFQYEAVIHVNRSTHSLIYKRKFSFGVSELPQTHYATIKKLFDAIHREDNHTITLKRDDAPAPAPAGANTNPSAAPGAPDATTP